MSARFKLKPIEILLMSYIHSLSTRGRCWASQKGMAKIMGTTETTVNQKIKKLVEMDLIEKVSCNEDQKKMEYKTTEIWRELVWEIEQFLSERHKEKAR